MFARPPGPRTDSVPACPRDIPSHLEPNSARGTVGVLRPYVDGSGAQGGSEGAAAGCTER